MRNTISASQPADPVANAGSRQPVKVKPLVWVETHEDRGDGTSEHNGGYEAESAFGVYEICMGFGSDCYYFSALDPNLNEIVSVEDLEDAKAAAQADYAARILSALEAAPRVSETPKSEHDRADVLTALEPSPVTLAEAARIVREAINKGHEPFRLAVNAAFREINCDGHVASVAQVAIALDAALRTIGEGEA